MDINEFYNEFNLVYNNLASNQAPGLDRYEISVYLTKAQTVLVDALYGEFEKSEEARRKLANLLVTKELNTVTVTSENILFCSNDNSAFVSTFATPTDLRYIVNEQVRMDSTADECVKGKFIKVQPVSLDEINTIIENPFKFNNRRALRLDSAENSTGNPYIEIITKQSTNTNHIAYYKIRYVKNPDPIILDEFSEAIDGINNTIKLGSLPETTHRQIVEIAAKMAYADYKN